MITFRLLFLTLTILLLPVATCAAEAEMQGSLDRVVEEWTSDLPQILKENRPVRILVSYNRTNFFLVEGAMRGMEHDLMQAYRKFLAKQHKKQVVRIVFVAVPFDKLIPALLEGRGDVIAAGLTVTDRRKKEVAFSAPYRTGVNEVIVGSPKVAPIQSLDDLSGRHVLVLSGSSYAEHLATLNTRLVEHRRKSVRVEIADRHLITEDLLELTARDMVEYTVADSHRAEIWKTALPGIQIFADTPLHTGGELAWAVRPGNKELLKSLDAFAKTVREGTLIGNMTFKRYYENSDWVKNPHANADKKKMDKLMVLFKKYGKQYDIDWLKLGALAYQESRLEMNTRSSRGAVGIMQVLPSTATGKIVNVQDYKTLEGNIHAGTKYLRFLMDRYFKDVEPEARVDFALAAYNAGPARIASLRKTAKAMKLDPNRWFGNVEYAAYRKIGSETPTYVANVQMYYAAFKSIYRTQVERMKAK